jgi:hypothetical protein
MTWRALLSFVAAKGLNFKSLGIFVRTTFKGGLDLKSGDPWAKILTANQFLIFKIIFKNILKNLILHFVAPSHFTLHPKAVKLEGRLLKDEPWPLRGFDHGFSF